VSEATQAALDARYATLATALRTRLLTFVIRAFAALPNYRDGDAAAFIEQVLPVVLGAQQQMGALTDGYLAQMIADMLGTAPVPAGVRLAEDLRGTPPAEVYQRPFATVRTALANGKSMTEAVTEGRSRLQSITATDMQLARTHATRQALAGDGRIRYFRRVLRGSFNCALCTIASTQRYSKERLMPIHPGCDCGVRPIPGDQDPGQVIDDSLLQAAHDAVAKGTGQADRGGRAPDYRQVIITREHGELGPLLAVRRHDFTGPRNLPPAPGD
jgi:hypothetical protein